MTQKRKIQVVYLTADRVDMAFQLIKRSTMAINEKELKRYLINFTGNYEYKRAVVALEKNKALGIALFSEIDESEVFLEHLYVEPAVRFQGIGKSLMNKVKSFSAKRTISKIDISNNFMPWMTSIKEDKKAKLSTRLGSFYSHI